MNKYSVVLQRIYYLNPRSSVDNDLLRTRKRGTIWSKVTLLLLVSNSVTTLHDAALNFLRHKHFVILSGLSGTGKTQLALKYARAARGLNSNSEPDPLIFECPVRPEWTDPTGLTGYFDVLHQPLCRSDVQINGASLVSHRHRSDRNPPAAETARP